MSFLGVDVPPVSHVTIWGSGPLGFNKTAAIYCFATIATILVFYFGTRRKDALVPAGLIQNTAESGVAFVRNQVIMQTIGVDGLPSTPTGMSPVSITRCMIRGKSRWALSLGARWMVAVVGKFAPYTSVGLGSGPVAGAGFGMLARLNGGVQMFNNGGQIAGTGGFDTVGYSTTSDWSFNAAFYGWASGLEGDVATLPGLPAAHIDLSFAVVIKHLYWHQAHIWINEAG